MNVPIDVVRHWPSPGQPRSDSPSTVPATTERCRPTPRAKIGADRPDVDTWPSSASLGRASVEAVPTCVDSGTRWSNIGQFWAKVDIRLEPPHCGRTAFRAQSWPKFGQKPGPQLRAHPCGRTEPHPNFVARHSGAPPPPPPRSDVRAGGTPGRCTGNLQRTPPGQHARRPGARLRCKSAGARTPPAS